MRDNTNSIDFAALAIALGDTYKQVATQMEDYLEDNISAMEKDQANLQLFTSDQDRILSYSNTFFSLGAKIAFQNAGLYIAAVQHATKAINENLDSINQTDKWINLAAGVISLGVSIVSGNGSGMVSAAETILGVFNITV
jgi:hypothetical protein